MELDRSMSLVYLLLLLALVVWFFMGQRVRMGEALRGALTWLGIFLAVVVGYGLWEQNRSPGIPGSDMHVVENRIEIPRSQDGHYYLQATVNGTTLPFLVDTGATHTVLSQRDADRIGVNLDLLVYSGWASTANGRVRTAPLRLETVQTGPFTDRDLRAFVNEGELEQSLLGMSYLNRWSRLEIGNDMLVLHR